MRIPLMVDHSKTSCQEIADEVFSDEALNIKVVMIVFLASGTAVRISGKAEYESSILVSMRRSMRNLPDYLLRFLESS
ncbi:hypothetical protein EVAR_25369_1 [Eumeta japonica]|uniref:Uncharacterized protein n=1 Tax=Eumeta variegata TaxID=151549 RepID=A0A4C1XZI1_EUMVA|nr:hypothetical protein EVAR_25369_1 [Eumeta japonica]